jgi:hypothetical protein
MPELSNEILGAVGKPLGDAGEADVTVTPSLGVTNGQSAHDVR